MSQIDLKLRAGDWVEVRSALEIAETLDTNGSLDGLPFMPEMQTFCNRRFQVLRPAEKTCLEVGTLYYAIQEFRNNDVVLLNELRCSGIDHDGCQRACFLFWKSAWLRKIEPTQSESTPQAIPDPIKAPLILRTMSAPGRYVCQATELVRATQPIPRLRKILKCFSDIRSGSRGVLEMARLVWLPIWRKATAWFPRKVLVGNLKKTPVGNLNLQPGELVIIKPSSEIKETLDGKGRNRGMVCDLGMCRYSGGTYKVRSRLDRMISEPTGEMRKVESTVILDGLQCLCWNTLGGCPRQDFMYWREVWLKRANGHAESTKSTPIGKDEYR